MAPLRVGIIGSGSWAARHAAAMQPSERVKLVAVTGGSRAGAFAEKFGLRVEPSVEALCAAKDIDFVDVVCPHGVHAQHTVCAASHGKHILVEKPMATSVAECDQMIEAASRNRVKLMVAHSRRYFPLVKQAKQVLDSGAIGRILMLRQLFSHNARTFGTAPGHWMSDPQLSMGFFIGYGCHQLDMTLHLVGSKVRTVLARFGNYWANSPIENCGAMFLDFESGAYSTFMELCSMPNELKAWPPFPEYHEVNELIGERGLMILRPYQRLQVRTGDAWETLCELEPKDADPILVFLREEAEAFADAVVNDTEPPVTAAQGRHTVEVIQAAYQSSQTGKAVYLLP